MDILIWAMFLEYVGNASFDNLGLMGHINFIHI